MTVLVTGGTGFIGKSLVKTLDDNNIPWLATARKPSSDNYFNLDLANTASIINLDLSGVSTVVHLAGLAHKAGTKEEFRNINLAGTKALVENAKKSGVKHFIFMSSIGVNGLGKCEPYRFDDVPNPQEDYAVSKLEAEIILKDLCEENDMSFTIIRPPLVYGKGAPGNFGALLKVAKRNLPLPLGAIHNKRSFVFVENLTNLILHCIQNQDKSSGKTFLVSDDEVISTTTLIRELIVASGQSPRLIPVPVWFLKLVFGFIGKKSTVERFASNLTVDIEHTKSELGWSPQISVGDGIKNCFK